MCHLIGIARCALGSHLGRSSRALQYVCESISCVLHNNADDVPISFQQCLPTNCIRNDTPDMPLKCGKILCHIHPFFFFTSLDIWLDQVQAQFHESMDENLPGLMLFLHEDTLACTLAYEEDIQQWRGGASRVGGESLERGERSDNVW